MSDVEVDLFVIGGGSGGTRAARVAAGHGARVMLAEEYRMGGTCVIRGCVPKKLFVYASRYMALLDGAAAVGWRAAPAAFEWRRLVAAVATEVTRLEHVYFRSLQDAGVTVVASRAVIEDAHSVRIVADGRLVRARTILVATGGRPERPDPSETELGVTSNEIFDLPAFPKRLAIAGAGYIAIEFASLFAALGSEVSIVCRGDNVLRGFDESIRGALASDFARRGIRTMFNDTVIGLEARSAGRSGDFASEIAVATKGGDRLVVDEILWAFGRVPNSDHLGLERAGVAIDADGAVVVDAWSQTSVPSIYAVGDVTNRKNLTPVAIREGHAFADSVFGGAPWHVCYDLVPTAVFSTPEIGCVGPTEAEARERGDAFDVDHLALHDAASDDPFFLKMLIERHSERVIGAHLFSDRAGELIQLIAIAVTARATRAAFLDAFAQRLGVGEARATQPSASR